MDSVLRIQVRVLARQAQKDLAVVNSEMKRVSRSMGQAGTSVSSGATKASQSMRVLSTRITEINKNLTIFGGNGAFTVLNSKAAALQKSLAAINVQVSNLNRVRLANLVPTGPSSKWSPSIAEKQRVAAAKAAAAEQKRVDQAALKAKQFTDGERRRIDKERTRLERMEQQQRLANQRKAAAQEKAINQSRVAAAKAVNTQMGFWQRASVALNGASAMSSRGLLAFGKDLQWIGRQLNFNFTLPLVAAGAGMTAWALEVERAWVRVEKVYGDGVSDYTEQLDKVKQAVRLLSDIYGVAQDEVTELAARWAAAGAEGAALVRSVETNLKLGILGDYQDLSAAFQDLITIQGAFQLSTGQVATAIALLNTVENTTAATMQDLTRAIALAGSSANVMGISIEELSAHIAALVPVTGSASNAGNALKTIYSRLLAPTADVVEVLDAMGIAFRGASFQALDGAGRLEKIAEVYSDLTDSQKGYVGSVVAGRRQLNRFLALIESIADKEGLYAQVMEDLDPKNIDQNWQRANNEIQKLLESDPRKITIVANQMKNLLIDAIIPLLPAITSMLGMLRNAIKWFSELDPRIQKTIGAFALLAIAAGVLSQIIGSLILLFGTILRPIVFVMLHLTGFAKAFLFAGTAAKVAAGQAVGAMARIGVMVRSVFMGLGALMVSPWGLALAAIAAFVFIFRDEVADAFRGIWEYIVRGFNMLPESIQRALKAVLDVVVRIVSAIWEALSYLNPFARHSPSLVDNVTAGVSAIIQQYSRLSNVSDVIRKSAADLAAFNRATADAMALAKASERGETRTQVTSVAGPGAGSALDTLWSRLDEIGGEMRALEGPIERQEEVVEKARQAYENAADAADDFDKSLQPLRDSVNDLSDEISEANQIISDLANMPITGMTAMSDAVFENEMAQKRIQLELLRTADITRDVDQEISSLNSKISELANTPIAGMKAMSDAIFDNEMAQKALRLEMLRTQETGAGFEDVGDRIAALNGDIELIRGRMTTLRLGGAGSDVLTTYDQELSALEAQRDALRENGNETDELQERLNQLQLEGEILALENALNFDPLLRQIDDLANGVDEMSFDNIVSQIEGHQDALKNLTPVVDENRRALEERLETLRTEGEILALEQSITFDPLLREIDKLVEGTEEMDFADIIAGIKEQKEVLADLIPEYERQSDELERQEEILRTMQDERDRLRDVYDNEVDSLEVLTDAYQNLDTQFRDIESAIQDVVSAYEELQNVGDGSPLGGGTDFGDLTGDFDEISLPDASDFNIDETLDEVLAELQGRVNELFDGEDIFAPFREQWENFKGWWDKNISPVFASIRGMWDSAWGHLDFSGADGAFAGIGNSLRGAWDGVAQWASDVWRNIEPFFRPFIDFFVDLWDNIEPHLGPIWDGIVSLFDDLVKAAGILWDALEPLVIIIGVALVAAWKVLEPKITMFLTVVSELAGLVARILGPALEVVGGIILALVQQFEGFLNIVAGIITLDWDRIWEGIKGLWESLKTVLWDVIPALGEFGVELLLGLGELIIDVGAKALEIGWEIVSGIVTGLADKAVDIFNWILDLPGKVIGWLKDVFGISSPASELIPIGVQIIAGIIKGLADALVDLLGWFLDLPGKILEKLLDAALWLIDLGWDLITGIVTGLGEAISGIFGWFLDLPGKIFEKLIDAASWLIDLGWDLITGIVTGLGEAISDIFGWFLDLPGKILEKLIDAASWLIDLGWDLITGIVTGLGKAIFDIFSWFLDLPGRILDILPDFTGVLIDAGADLIGGFIEGIETAGSAIGGIFSSLNPFGGGGDDGPSVNSSIPTDINRPEDDIDFARMILGDIEAAKIRMKEAGEELVDEFDVGVGIGLENLSTTVNSISDQTVDQLNELASRWRDAGVVAVAMLSLGISSAIFTLVSTVAAVRSAAETSMDQLAPRWRDAGVVAVAMLSVGISSGIFTLVNSVVAIRSAVENPLNDLGPRLQTVGRLSMGLFANGITQGATGVGGAASNAIGGIFSVLDGSTVNFIVRGRNLMGAVGVGILGAAPGVIGSFRSIVSSLTSAIGPNTGAIQHMEAMGWDMMWGLAKGANRTVLHVRAYLADIMNSIVNVIWSVDLGGRLHAVGWHAMNGFWNGLKQVWGSVASWWNQTAGSIGGGSAPAPPASAPTPPKTTQQPGFHTGGIVPGRNEIDALLMGGEMVLTREQQATLFSIANDQSGNVARQRMNAASRMRTYGNNMSTSTVNVSHHEEKTINFNGDLSFPNITDPEDAKKFLDNLEMVASE